ncbi:prolyl oligopeptidase family serine peptidase [Ferrovibrio sp.]|uniref:alpha/beta hydrolase n=1 Tax=Ferrovibrio sp. TaxID=1917215 RepID=UPI00260EF0FB|nr:prolyl oligopeptidase family serine peptidase [Ferrovibrio sp.]
MTEQQLSRGAIKLTAFDNAEMDFQLMRSLGAVAFGGGSVGEIARARSVIRDGDPASWVAAFRALAARVEAPKAGGDALRGAAALRASMYWRAAEYYARPEQAADLGRRSRIVFQAAMELLGITCETIVVMLNGESLTGYLLPPMPATKQPAPLIVALSGFDGSTEELYFEIGAAARQRGYACLLIEGPGQAGTRRENPHSIFAPDYAPVVTAFINSLRGRKTIDLERSALYGISFGGYFASQAMAAGVPCQALIANSPILDLQAYMTAFIGSEFCADPPDIKVDDIDTVPDEALPPLLKHGLRASCLRFGTDSFAGFLQRLSDFRVPRPGDIRCPALALYGEGEGAEVECQAKAFAAQVNGPVTLRQFRDDDGAGDHCQFGNLALSAAVVLDWLDDLWA